MRIADPGWTQEFAHQPPSSRLHDRPPSYLLVVGVLTVSLAVSVACAAPPAAPAAVPEVSRTYVAALGADTSAPASGTASAAPGMTLSSGAAASGQQGTGAATKSATDGAGGSAANSVIPSALVPSELVPSAVATSEVATTRSEPSGRFTLALAGDFNFSGRTADLLAEDPATALREAADQLSAADITMVNLETAITTGGTPAPKQFHFRAPPTALQALADGGVDIATMANNHAVDYGDAGLADTLDAIATSPIPVIGIGRDADAAYTPWMTTVNGARVAILAASQVHDWTIASHTASDTKAGIASAFSPKLIEAVRTAAAAADVVVVYLHWGIEYQSCPSGEQRRLADQLADAGATAVVGTHAHLLQGAGWRDDGVYVAYGLGNYYWWRSFGNRQDDNGVLTLNFDKHGVVAADFLATRLDSRGVPMPATGDQLARIRAEWEADRVCADLSRTP
ncbi:MAG: CapA family protein [Nakamurella sp.]